MYCARPNLLGITAKQRKLMPTARAIRLKFDDLISFVDLQTHAKRYVSNSSSFETILKKNEISTN